jgi:hypothetical protein
VGPVGIVYALRIGAICNAVPDRWGLAVSVHVSLGWIFMGSFHPAAGAMSEKPTIDKIKRAKKAPLAIVGEADRPKPVPVSHVLALRTVLSRSWDAKFTPAQLQNITNYRRLLAKHGL